MLRLEVDAGEAVVFARDWGRAHPKAAESAFRAELFRLKSVTDARLAAGVGPEKAPLTQEEARAQGTAALAAFARFSAYEVTREGADLEGRVGFSRWITRARNPQARKRTLTYALGGGPHTIDRDDQARIARKLRKRMGEPVARRRRKARRPARHDWADLNLMLPKVGRLLDWPARDVMAQVVAAEGATTPRNLGRLYQIALSGQRWARRWWTDVPGQVAKAYSRPGAMHFFD